jgi:hypothetical protein
MATGGGLAETFKKFATKADGKEATTADINKWCKDAGVYGKACTPQHVDISFSKVKPKGGKLVISPRLDSLFLYNKLVKYFQPYRG